MPYKCCVPGCKTNYKDGPKFSVFSFPKDEDLQRKWLRAICRDNFVLSKNSKVCELHFRDYEIERTVSEYNSKTGEKLTVSLKYPRLVEGSIPSQLPNCPHYLSSQNPVEARESPASRRERLENSMLNSAIQESIGLFQNYTESVSVRTLEDIKTKLHTISNTFPVNWTVITRENSVNIVQLGDTPHLTINCSVQVTNDLILSVFFGSVEIKSLPNIKVRLPVKVSSITLIDQIVNECQKKFAKTDEPNLTIEECVKCIVYYLDKVKLLVEHANDEHLAFLKEQVSLIPVYKTRVRFSCNIMIFCSLLYSISPSAYKFLRASKYLIIPSPSTIRQVCSTFQTNPHFEQDSSNLLKYISLKCSMLKDEDKSIALLMDEIHLKEKSDYKGGSVVGKGFGTEELAKSAYVFMITSMSSSYKEVVHILPIKSIQGDILHQFLRKIIVKLEDIGFEVIAVVSDNISVNSKAMSFFNDPPTVQIAYSHPKDDSRKLYFVIDPVHILKCIRNNWLNKTNQEMIYPDFNNGDCTVGQIASFTTLKELHAHEQQNLLKYGVNLTLKSLYPTNIERQNVKLALQVFNPKICIALRELGRQCTFENWENTANYIEIICKWWDIINVKTPLKGQRLKNPFQEPITKTSSHILNFLQNLIKWLERWEKLPNAKMLTKETHFALKHTTLALLQISEFWLNEKGNSYFLFGKVQTDNLEDHFGRYRQLAGSNYHISARQLFECESKLRILSTMKMAFKSHTHGEISVHLKALPELSQFLEKSNDGHFSVPPTLITNCQVDDDDIDAIPDSQWPLLTYIAGYISFAIVRKLKCQYCEVFLCERYDADDADNGKENRATNNLIKASDRGGLCYPNEDVVLCAAYVHVIVSKLLSKENEEIFLEQKSQRCVVIALGVQNKPQNVFLGHSCLVHSVRDLHKKILCITSNIFLNNYTKNKNDIVKTRNMPQVKRFRFDKLQ